MGYMQNISKNSTHLQLYDYLAGIDLALTLKKFIDELASSSR